MLAKGLDLRENWQKSATMWPGVIPETSHNEICCHLSPLHWPGAQTPKTIVEKSTVIRGQEISPETTHLKDLWLFKPISSGWQELKLLRCHGRWWIFHYPLSIFHIWYYYFIYFSHAKILPQLAASTQSTDWGLADMDKSFVWEIYPQQF